MALDLICWDINSIYCAYAIGFEGMLKLLFYFDTKLFDSSEIYEHLTFLAMLIDDIKKIMPENIRCVKFRSVISNRKIKIILVLNILWESI